MFRKLLREDQLEPVTKAAQQEELERRKRLEQQRKDYAAPIPTVPLELFPGKPWRGQEGPHTQVRRDPRCPQCQGQIWNQMVASQESFQSIHLLRSTRAEGSCLKS